MSKVQSENKFKSLFAAIAIPVLIAIAILIYIYVLGAPTNFVDGKTENHPVKDGVGHVLGLIYKGGFIVPILISFVLINITFSIERFFTINKASGKGSNEAFVRKIKGMLSVGHIDEAIRECDKQQGSVANVVRASLQKYKEVEKESNMDRDQKVLAIQKEVEEATSLELPMLERNLVIISTLSSVSTLVALLGTVLGMIKAFASLASEGAGSSEELANGISEALINTALGIANSAIAIIMYNVFTTRIDKITYTIDEAGFSIAQTFSSSHKN